MDKYDKIVDQLIIEAFTSGEYNVVKGNSVSGRGETVRQMLSGEWFGSVAKPFWTSTNPMYSGEVELAAGQAESGQGEMTGGPGLGVYGHTNVSEAVVDEILDKILGDSPSAMYTDPQSVGFLINNIREYGYEKIAEGLEAACQAPSREAIVFINEAVNYLENECENEGKCVDEHTMSQLTNLGNNLISLVEEAEVPAEDDKEDEKDTPEGTPSV
jgi:hypothetical protein